MPTIQVQASGNTNNSYRFYKKWKTGGNYTGIIFNPNINTIAIDDLLKTITMIM